MAWHFDVVGYHCDGEAYCSHCFENRYIEKHGESWREVMEADLEGQGGPIFAGDEWEYRPVCGSCQEPLEVSLTWEAQQQEEITDLLEYHQERYQKTYEKLPRIYERIVEAEYLIQRCDELAEQYPHSRINYEELKADYQKDLERWNKKLECMNDIILEHLQEVKKLKRQLSELQNQAV